MLRMINSGSSRRTVSANPALRPSRMTEDFSHLVTFDSNDQLCRATGVTQIMRKCAALFGNSAGSATTYAFSKPVKKLDCFFSHNWVVGRLQKFIVLAVYFNHVGAAVATAVYSVSLGILLYLDQLPVADNGTAVRSFLGQITCVPLYVLVLLTLHDLMWLFGRDGGTAFLDKTCIHQTDVDLKCQGILKLAAFLHRSRKMIVIYSDVYLRKVWTVYEIAAFLSLHPMDDLIVLPVTKQMLFFTGMIVAYTCQLVLLVGWSLGGSFRLMAYPLFGFVGSYGYISVTRKWYKHTDRILNDVANFTIRSCNCFCEDDRPVVYRNIASLLRGSAAIPAAATEDHALDRFDTLVRTQVLERFLTCAGRSAFNYHQYCCLGLAVSGGIVVDNVALAAHGVDRLVVLSGLVSNAGFALGFWGLCSRQMEFVGRTKLHLKGWHEVAWIAIVVPFGCVLPCGIVGVLGLALKSFAAASVVWSVVQVVVWVLLSGLAWWLCRLDEQASTRVCERASLQTLASSTGAAAGPESPCATADLEAGGIDHLEECGPKAEVIGADFTSSATPQPKDGSECSSHLAYWM